MKTINKTRGTVLAENVEVTKGFWRKTLGLMFRSKIGDSAGFLMEFEHAGYYGIDLIFIDSRKKVVDTFEDIKPVGINPGTWRVYKPSKPAKWVLELPAGRIKKTKTSVRDNLFFR